MSGINIDDWLLDSGSFIALENKVGLELAIGYYFVAVRLARIYWDPEKKPIPKNLFMNLSYAEELINCGLAVDLGESILVVGLSFVFHEADYAQN